jgi:hypothetical protein
MPKGKWDNLSVRKEVREELEGIAEELKLHSLSDAIAFLIASYRNCRASSIDVERLSTLIVTKIAELFKTHSVNKQVFNSSSLREDKQTSLGASSDG